MLQRFRESLALVLVTLLPFHAILVTVLTKVIAGPGHAPLSVLALWKEGLLGVILCLCVVEICIALIRENRERGLSAAIVSGFDRLDVLIVLLIALSLVVTVLTHGDWKLYLLGFKYDFIPLVAFLLLRRVEWSDWFRSAAVTIILVVGSIVAGYGILTFFLPLGFFTWLGYSDAHSLYDVGKPLAAYHQIGESTIRRIQSTMSGPNQLGLWLLIPFGLLLAIVTRWLVARSSLSEGIEQRACLSGRQANQQRATLLIAITGVLIVVALFLSFSRSAWIGAFVMVMIALWHIVPRRLLRRFIASMLGFGIVAGVLVSLVAPQVFFRLSSSRGHLVRPIQGLKTMVAHPLGLGLGKAGPASNRVSETCVHLRPIDDPSWAKSTPDLCVFLGDRQVQPDPSTHTCKCPFLPENWYVQIGVELGVLGFFLYLILVCVVTRWLVTRYSLHEHIEQQANKQRATIGEQSSLLAFIGISIGAIFLHAWEDAAVAYSAWLLLAVSLGHLEKQQSSSDLRGIR